MSKDFAPKIPRGVRGLPPQNVTPPARAELNALKRDVAEIERWWSDSSRWQHTQRVYSGEYSQQGLSFVLLLEAPLNFYGTHGDCKEEINYSLYQKSENEWLL
jgi:hypothetical protein